MHIPFLKTEIVLPAPPKAKEEAEAPTEANPAEVKKAA